MVRRSNAEPLGAGEAAPDATGVTAAFVRRARRHTLVRYVFAVVIVVAAFGLKKLLEPVTGTGAPFVLFFAAVAITSLVAGPGPGIVATVLSMPFGAYVFVVRAGYAPSQAAFQAALFAVDGLIVVYLSYLMTKARRAAERAEESLRLANAAAGIFAWDLEVATGRLRWAASAGGFGLPEGAPSTLTGWLGLVHAEDRAAFERAFQSSLDPTGEGKMAVESRIVRPDGAVRWFQWMGRTYHDGRDAVRQVGTAIDVTERRQREGALRDLADELARSEARRRDLIELAPDAFFLADLDARLVDVNHAACQLLGYEREELVGKTILDIIPPEDAPRLAAAREAMLVPGHVDRAEWTQRRKDGTFVSVEVSSNILPDGRWQAFVRDITQRKRIEDERQIFVSLLENSSDFVGIADADGKPLYLNPAGRRMVGLPADFPVEPTRIPDYYPPDERAFITDVILASMIEHGRWSGETRLRNWRTGEAIPVSDEHFMVRDPSGKRVLGMATITRDISEIKRAARERDELLAREQLARQQAEAAYQQLRDSEERFRLTIDEAPIGMALVALDGRFDRVNAALCAIVGYTAAELEQLRFQDITHPEDLDSDLTLVGRLTRGEIPNYRLEKRYLRKGGAPVPIMLSASILRGPDGAPRYYIAQVEDITERKRAEAALQQSEQEFRVLADSMPQVVWVTRPDGMNIYFNQQWVSYTGLSLEESYGEGWIKPFHPEDRQRAWDAWQHATRERDTYELECRLRRADGVYRWWLIRGAPSLGPDGEIVKWFGTCTDIEQIKLAEQRLKESEAKFSGIISISADAIISIDDAQRITIFNEGAQRIFGYTRGEVVGADLNLLIPEGSRAAHRRHVAGFAAGEATARRMGERVASIKGRRKNGEEFPAEAAISKLVLGGETVLTVALRDVTAQKRVEKEQRFLAEAGEVLAASLDYEQTLATLGQLVVRELADWCILDLVEGEHPKRLKVVSADPLKAPLAAQLEQFALDKGRPHPLRTVLESGRPLVMERMTPETLESFARSPEHLKIMRAIGPRSAMAVPLMLHGQILGVLTFVSCGSRLYGPSDLGLAEALADRAALAIENGRLYQSAVHATRLRDEVLGVVAHDLRNPLSAIQLQVAALQRRGGETDARDFKSRETISRAAERMNRLINDLLDVSLIEAGQLGIDRAPISAHQLILDAVEAQRLLASSASLELRLDLANELPDVWADQLRMLQVLANLVGNAIKFTPAGGRITLGAAPRDREVLFWVADTGSGISPEGLPHVFDRFWQAKKGARKGAGLGLPITRGIVEAHGGRIWVESTLGRGSIFFFTVPQAAHAEARVPEATKAPH